MIRSTKIAARGSLPVTWLRSLAVVQRVSTALLMLSVLHGVVVGGVGAEEAVIETELGDIRLVLLADKAPRHVENFKKLARAGFYEGTTFHRVIPGYIVQGGSPTSKDADPKNDNYGTPGYSLEAEFNDARHIRAAISMARAVDDPNSAGSQFFIMLGDAPELDEIRFTVFGRVSDGMAVADRMAGAPRDETNDDRPMNPVKIKRVRMLDATTPTPSATAVAAAAAAAVAPVGTEGSKPTPELSPPGEAALGAGERVRVTQGVVNVRGGPGTESAVVEKVKQGAELAVKARDGKWILVDLGSGRSGYVREDMVEVVP